VVVAHDLKPLPMSQAACTGRAFCGWAVWSLTPSNAEGTGYETCAHYVQVDTQGISFRYGVVTLTHFRVSPIWSNGAGEVKFHREAVLSTEQQWRGGIASLSIVAIDLLGPRPAGCINFSRFPAARVCGGNNQKLKLQKERIQCEVV